MKRLFTFLMITLLSAVAVQAQRPDFSLVGFGVGTVGGTGGTEVQIKTYADLAANVTGTDKKILKINGTITGPNGGVILDIGSNKSIIGVGSTAMLSMINLHLKNSQQIIIQNLKMSMIGSTLGSDADLISIETTSSNTVKYVWIDHCELFNVRPTLPETAAKKDLYDGMIDIKKASSLITISWCYFHDHWKCSLIGYTSTDTLDRKITYHHNYFKNIKSRAPSYRGGTGHIYNNYYDGLTGTDAPLSDAANSREHACLKVESNYFKNYDKTIYCALDDVVNPGYAYGTNNLFDNSPAQTADLCSSFTPPYTYKVDPTANVPNIVVAWSGVGKLDGSVVTNIENVEISENNFSFYPSPVKDLLTMELNIDDISNSNLTIKDNTGKTVLTPKLTDLLAGSNTLQIDMSQLKSGVYHCILFNGYKNISKTLVKE